MAKKKKNRVNKVGAALAGGAALTVAGFNIGPDFTSSAEAGITYVDINPDFVRNGLYATFPGPYMAQSYALTALDGSPVVQFSGYNNPPAMSRFYQVQWLGTGLSASAILSGTIAKRFASGATINTASPQADGASVGGYFTFNAVGSTFGNFVGQGVSFLGFEAKVGGAPVVGWLKLTQTQTGVTLFGYAYNDMGTTITAGQTSSPPPVIPEPSTFVMMGLGATAALAYHRNRRKRAEKKAVEEQQA